jgi:TolB protein
MLGRGRLRGEIVEESWMASPIGHGFLGAAIYLWSRPRGAPRPRAGMLLGAIVLANLPDSDFLVGFAIGRKYHHQHIHTIAFAVAVAALLAAAARAWRRPAGRVFVVSLLLVLSHLLADTFTMDTKAPYGSMLFWPITSRYYISSFPIFLDVWRGSWQLAFGYHNVNMALRELAIGLSLLGLVGLRCGWPRPQLMRLWGAAAAMVLVAAAADAPLAAAGERQMEAHLGRVEASGKPPVTGGRGILFSSSRFGNQDIFLIQPDGSGLRRLTDHEADEAMPVWSPDGERIVFESNRGGDWDIYTMRRDGSDVRRLTSHPAQDESPTWSHDGRFIIFTSDRGGNGAIYRIDAADGSGLTPVTTPGAQIDVVPSASPVAPEINFTSRTSLLPNWQIYRVPITGGEPVRISPQGGCRAKWSPDGKYLAYVSKGRHGTTDIWVFERSGGGLRRITRTPEYDYDPTWSPDGREICFARGREGKSGWDLWIVEVNTGALRRLTDRGAGDRYPCWR